MYSTPPLLANGSITTIAGSQNSTTIPAPGALWALRIAYISVAASRANAGICNITVRFTAAEVVWETELSLAGKPSDSIVLPFPGVASINNNNLLQIVNNCSAAGDTIRWQVGYYMDYRGT